jgi:hypothetical protein
VKTTVSANHCCPLTVGVLVGAQASEVIQRGDPIVSLSIGAAANFAYGRDRFEFDEVGRPVAMEGGSEPASVRLESGDLLVRARVSGLPQPPSLSL